MTRVTSRGWARLCPDGGRINDAHGTVQSNILTEIMRPDVRYRSRKGPAVTL